MKQARPVVVQRHSKTSTRWVTIATISSGRTGAYGATVRAPSAGTYYVRVVAPRIVVRGKVFPALVSATKNSVVVAQTAALTIPTTLMSGQSGTALVSFRPIRMGRTIALQVLRGNKWISVATGRESSRGAASFALAAGAPGTYSYRAYAAPANGAAAVVSVTKRLVVTPAAVTTAPVAEPLTAAEQSNLSAFDPATGSVTFAGGPLAGVAVGDVLVSGPTSATPDGLLRRVQSIAASAGTTTYATQPAALAQVVTNVPDALSSLPLDVVAEQVTAVDPGVTITPASGRAAKVAPRTFVQPDGVTSVDAPTVSFGIDLSKEVTVPGSNAKVTFKMNGPMTVTPRAVFQFDADWGQVKRVEMRAGFGTTSNLTWSVSTPVGTSLANALSSHWSLLTIERWYGAFIGPVPVAVRVKLELIADINVKGQLSLSWKSATNGELTAGLRATAPSLTTPVPVVTTPTGTSSGPSLSLSGSAGGTVGGSLSMYLYGVAGPSGELGVEAKAQASIGSGGALTCSASLGPYASVSLNASFAVLGFTWQHQLWKSSLAPWLRWSACGAPPPPPKPQLVVTPSSGIAGDRLTFDASPRCPAVPAGYFQIVSIKFTDAAGVPFNASWSVGTDSTGKVTPTGIITPVQSELLEDLTGRWYFGREDIPVGRYTVHAQCERHPNDAHDDGSVTQTFAPADYTVTGPSQRLILAPGAVEPGQAFEVSGAQPCPSGTVGVEVTDFDHVYDPVPVDAAGNWTRTITLPGMATVPYLEIGAWCMASADGSIRRSYGHATLTVSHPL
ncbi:hypothetical protein [Kribbella yunnanensis]|uniref:hypothetical protein n=1 Tax=Kribbella yunnanensis TaxID=190194 RepID=UPI0031DC3DCE